MNYHDALAWLYGTQVFGIKLGLGNTARLMAVAGDPHRRLRFLHVAGTNGKGSVCAMLDAVCREAGLRCGLHTSPHLVDFCERIRVDGVPIPPEAAAEGLTLLRGACAGWDHQPTFFEIVTVLAAWWFDRAGVDIVAWETGMGGRLDATNIVAPRVSVLTPVGLDHQQWLGGTLAAIAGEKAGIIKPGVPVVSAPQPAEVRAVLRSTAEQAGSTLAFVESPHAGPVNLAGEHQRWNAATALAALDAAGLAPGTDARARGLAAVQWPARFQRAGEGLVLDGAHNAAAAAVLARTWRDTFGETRARLVFGAMHDKDTPEILRVLRTIADEIVLVRVANGRAAPVGELRAAAEACGFPVIREGALADILPGPQSAPVLVAGSLFLAGEALALLGNAPPPRPSNQ